MESVTATRKGAASAAPEAAPATSGGQANVQSRQEIDGFHLLIDALKLNGIDTIFGLPGIPITDLTRKAQAAGLRVISFRHEQNAGKKAPALETQAVLFHQTVKLQQARDGQHEHDHEEHAA